MNWDYIGTSLFLLFIASMSLALAEIITIKNDTHIACVTNDENPLYVEPLEEQKSKNELNFLDADIWDSTKWTLISSNNTAQGPILDKRWEDLETVYINYYRATWVSSFSFSVYDPGKIEFFIDDDEYMDYFSFLTNSTLSWNHYTVVIKDGNTYVFENFLNKTQSSVLVRSTTDFNPIQIVIKSNNKTYWKIHEYFYRETKTISQEPTKLPIPQDVGPCLMMYTLLCEKCCLDIETNNDKKEHICYKQLEESSEIIKSWQSWKIPVDSTDSISLVRSTTDGTADGYWGLDIRQCPKISNNGNYIYEQFLSASNNTNRLCKSLNGNNTQVSRIKRNLQENNIFKCDPGVLGSNCDLQCKEVLGDDKTYCEKHKICENDDCVCAWGFEGTACNKPCTKGTWGLSCEKTCPSNCRNQCDRKSGNCKNSKFRQDHSIDISKANYGVWVGTSCAVLLVLIILLVSWLLYKKRKNANDTNTSKTENQETVKEPLVYTQIEKP